MASQHVQVGASAGTGALIAVAVGGALSHFGWQEDPAVLSAVGALLAPFASWIYGRLGQEAPSAPAQAGGGSDEKVS